MKARKKVAASVGPRPYRTEYPGGLRSGYCKTHTSAVECAFKHLNRGEERRATVELDGTPLIWLTFVGRGVVNIQYNGRVAPKPIVRRVK